MNRLRCGMSLNYTHRRFTFYCLILLSFLNMASELHELTFEFWMDIGKTNLQLSGSELLSFAEGKFNERLAIENRRIEREEKKERERLEREDRLFERNRQKEDEDRRLEFERLELEKQRLDKLTSGNSNCSSNSTIAQDNLSVAIPKLKLYESGEDITAYLIRFENLAKLSGWPKES